MKAILTREQLCTAKCLVLDNTEGNNYSLNEVTEQLRVVPDWRLRDGFIEKQYHFRNYYDTIAFVNALAYMIHAQDHHPELTITYNKCLVKFNTHSVSGISINDFICAAKADMIASQ
jgi:4a-hydroxytetrahydrobiopterin dehydratase